MPVCRSSTDDGKKIAEGTQPKAVLQEKRVAEPLASVSLMFIVLLQDRTTRDCVELDQLQPALF